MTQNAMYITWQATMMLVTDHKWNKVLSNGQTDISLPPLTITSYVYWFAWKHWKRHEIQWERIKKNNGILFNKMSYMKTKPLLIYKYLPKWRWNEQDILSLYPALGTSWHVSTANIHTSRPIHQSDQSTGRNVKPLPTHRAPIEDSDQTARMRRLIWVFDRCRCQNVPLAGVRSLRILK